MRSDPDKLLNQLVVAALTMFTVVIILLAALVLRELWLQQQVADLSADVQDSLDDLEEITRDIEQELVEGRVAEGDAQNLNNWAEIGDALDNVDEQLQSIDENLSDVVSPLDSEAEITSTSPDDDRQPDVIRNWIDQTFAILAMIVGIAGIVIAVLLGVAVRVVSHLDGN